jgi:hypothetical protein
LSLFVCALVFGPMAWIMGNQDLNDMRQGRMDPSGEGLTRAGKILGIIGVSLFAAVILFYCGAIIIAGIANVN